MIYYLYNYFQLTAMLLCKSHKSCISPLHVGVHDEARLGMVVDCSRPDETRDGHHNLPAVGFIQGHALDQARPLHHVQEELVWQLFCNTRHAVLHSQTRTATQPGCTEPSSST